MIPTVLDGTLTGHLYYDTNGNATQDFGEPNLPNVDVEITNVVGIVQIVTTDANGNWGVTVPEGNTTSNIDVTDPDFPLGATQTEGTNPTTTFVTGSSLIAETDDGFVVPSLNNGTLTGHLYYDTNANGSQDAGEPNLPNIDVEITNVLGIVQIVATNANGDWSITVPEGNTISNIDETDLDFNPAFVQTQGTDPTTTIVIANSTTSEISDGFSLPVTDLGVLKGHLYLDANGNGNQENGEANLPNIDVQIIDAFGIVLIVETDTNGDWQASLPTGPATSNIDVTDPDFPTGAIQTEGTNPTTTVVIANVTTNETDDGFTFTDLETGTLKGHLYNDLNGNGTQDTTEPDLANIDVEVTDVLGIVQVVETDVVGNWSAILPEGTATSDIDITDPDFPEGAIQTEGTNPTTTVVLANVVTSEPSDGFQAPVNLQNYSGHMYLDLNGSFSQDSDEPNLPNVDVEVIDANGVVQTLTSDANGDWSILLPLGNVTTTIQINDPDFPENAVQTEGENPTNSIITTGTPITEVDGFYVTALSTESLTGHIYEDLNGNSTQDPNEPSIPNIDVEVTDALGISQTVESNAIGDWSALVPLGNALSFIQVDDVDFPDFTMQTQGSNPTLINVISGVVNTELDGFYLERLKVFNAISPNNDSKNDFFYIQGIEKYPDNKLSILNRWGVIVYEVKGYGQNGRLFRGISEGRATLGKDEQLPTGSYFYFLEYRDESVDLQKKTVTYILINKN
ncbi:gliding motility-associated C-terminal domain-containing protein [Mesonia ostreae]|uniref:Gliding motility-associated C-terminal domain-containing protein n=1 Tax=Mesonia ostreae TaxID=861110 RepID=A0ABU2KM64_9FLAO|nr:gliding motility-associated C-terminal domain-containing protein [Mesonia ostreae]MDT0295806.1 gliding motility-associated C-terminal domain-containing protein [Mesonia ostreae]